MPMRVMPCLRAICVLGLGIGLCVQPVGSQGNDNVHEGDHVTAGARRLRGEAAEDPEAAEIQQLRSKLQQEKTRAEIAGYASMTAMQNATKEAAERKKAEVALAKVTSDFQAADASLAKEKHRVEELQAQLVEARKASNSTDQAVAAQIQEAKAAQAKAEAETKSAEARAASDEKAVQAAQEAEKASEQRTAAMKAAAEAARRRSSHGVQSMSDFALISLLRSCPMQPVVGLVVGAAGLYSIVEGASFFRGFVVLLFASAAGLCVCAEVLAFGGGVGIKGSVFAGGEAALVTGLAVSYGLDGFQIVAGALLGLGLAYSTCAHIFLDSPETRLYEVAWYSVAALIAAIAITAPHAHDVVGPLAGGLLFAGFIVYTAAVVVASSEMGTYKFPDFVEALLTGRGALSVFGQQAVTAWIIGVCIWTVVFALGVSRHFCNWPSFGERDEYMKADRRKGSRSPSNRTEPLLGDSRDDPRDDRRGVRRFEEPPRSSGRSRSGSDKKDKKTSRKDEYAMYGHVG